MNTKLLISHVLVAVLAFGSGFILSRVIQSPSPVTDQRGMPSDQDSATEEEAEQPQALAAMSPPKTDRALDFQGENQHKEQEAAQPDDAGEQTAKQKLAAYRKLSQDPEVRQAMMEESLAVMEDPATRDARRERLQMEANFYYEELVAELGLDDERRDRLLELWVDGKVAEMEVMLEMQKNAASGGLDEEQQRALQARIAAVNEQAQQNIADLLGPDYQEYEDYTETVQDRANLNKMYASGQPLDSYTKEAVLLIMKEENAVIGELESYYGNDMSQVASIQRNRLERTASRNDNVIKRSSEHMTDEQLEVLATSLQATQAQMETSLKYLEAMVKRQQQEEDVEE
jgi:hypothetical protein